MLGFSKLVRSTKITKSANGKDCTLRLPGCDFLTETTVFAHVGRNRGIGIKCGDNMGVYACKSCHRAIDGEHRNTFSADILRALEETQQQLFDAGILEVK